MTGYIYDDMDREKYLALLGPHFLEREIEAIGTAYLFSKYGHRNQTRDDGTRYFDHPRAVSLIATHELGIYDADLVVICLLHDIREDSFLLSEHRTELNFGERVARAVKLLSKDASSKPIYMPRLKESHDWRALIAKLCDRVHNMRCLGSCMQEKQLKQVAETREHFFEIGEKARVVVPERYRAAVDRIEQMLRELCDVYDPPVKSEKHIVGPVGAEVFAGPFDPSAWAYTDHFIEEA